MLTASPIRLLILLLLVLLSASCQTEQPAEESYANFTNAKVPDEFADYWYQGEAEINAYKLEIFRYGERRTGDAVLVFVTEDFSKSKQVKLDYPDQSPDDKVSVLKLNNLWKFKTGIYDYSMMNSTFTPIQYNQYPHSLKHTTSSQEWCGHTFTQFNLQEDDRYSFRSFSYFEQEGDQKGSIAVDMLEDELWNRLRINPQSIPRGEVNLLAGLFYQRLSHDSLKPHRARIRFAEKEGTTQCIVEYLHLDRTLTINFENAFPRRILSWTEVQNGKEMVRASLEESLKSDYWNRNSNQYLNLRDSLSLSY
jgi:hypothetical protein